jgi:hypothetical protein
MVKGLIYKIWSPGRPEVYVGSSTRSLAKIQERHNTSFRKWLHDKGNFVSSFYIFYQKLAGHPVHFESIHEGEFENVDALRKLEREYIEKLPTVNERTSIRVTEDKNTMIICPKCKKVTMKKNLKRHQTGQNCSQLVDVSESYNHTG